MPRIKYSNIVGQRPSVPSGGATCPVSVQTCFPITLSGFCGNCGAVSSSTFSISACQIGAAPVIPETIPLIGLLSLFPTHVATTREGVYPIVQLSRRSFVVPVLTDTG